MKKWSSEQERTKKRTPQELEAEIGKLKEEIAVLWKLLMEVESVLEVEDKLKAKIKRAMKRVDKFL